MVVECPGLFVHDVKSRAQGKETQRLAKRAKPAGKGNGTTTFLIQGTQDVLKVSFLKAEDLVSLKLKVPQKKGRQVCQCSVKQAGETDFAMKLISDLARDCAAGKISLEKLYEERNTRLVAEGKVVIRKKPARAAGGGHPVRQKNMHLVPCRLDCVFSSSHSQRVCCNSFNNESD